MVEKTQKLCFQIACKFYFSVYGKSFALFLENEKKWFQTSLSVFQNFGYLGQGLPLKLILWST
jgi:hypothetical protein